MIERSAALTLEHTGAGLELRADGRRITVRPRTPRDLWRLVTSRRLRRDARAELPRLRAVLARAGLVLRTSPLPRRLR